MSKFHWWKKSSLSKQLLTGFGISLFTVGLTTLSVNYRLVQLDSQKQIQERAQSITLSLEFATEGLLEIENTSILRRVVQNYATLPAIMEIAIVNPDGVTLAHSSLARQIQYTSLHPELAQAMQQASSSGVEISQELALNGKPAWVQILPFNSVLFKTVGRRGLAIAILDLKQMQQQVGRTFLTSTITLLSGMVVILLIMGLLLRRKLLKPLDSLNQSISLSKKTGKFEQPQSLPPNEIKFLASTFDDVFKQLVAYEQLQSEIASRQQAEATLRESEERLQAILDNSPAVIFLKDIQGNILLINRQFETIFNLHRDEVIGKTDYDLFPKEVADAVAANDRRVIQTGVPLQLEEIIPQSDGLHTYISSKFLLYNSERVAYAICGIATDISDRKQAEAAMQKAKEEAEIALQQFQLAQTQLIQSEKMSSLGQLVAGVAHEINNPVNFIHGNIHHINQYTQDVLDLLQLYQAQYPNPTAEIADRTEEIDIEFLQEDFPKLVSSMKVGADRIREIVQSLRTFSRLDEAEVKEVDIHEGIDSTLMILQSRLKAKSNHPEIQVVKQYGQLPQIECYAGQLNQVFMNILSNAIDALEESTVKTAPADIKLNPSLITITTKLVEGKRVAIHIADNGPGIPEAIQQRLFDPFFTTKAVGKGTGLGMSISHQVVVQRHRGTLHCISNPGQGAEFVIEIPIQQ